MNCKRASELIDGYLFGELFENEKDEFLNHIESCAPCREELEKAKKLNSLLSRLTAEPPKTLSAEVMRALDAERRSKRNKLILKISATAAAAVIVATAVFKFADIFRPDNCDPTCGNDITTDTADESRVDDLDISYFFTSEGILAGNIYQTNFGTNEALPSRPSTEQCPDSDGSRPEEDNSDTSSAGKDTTASTLAPEGTSADAVPPLDTENVRYYLEKKAVNNYLICPSESFNTDSSLIVFSYDEYLIYVYDASDKTLPDNMSTLNSAAPYSIIITKTAEE